MKIPQLPFNTSSVYAANDGVVHEGGDQQDDGANLDAYHGYYNSPQPQRPHARTTGLADDEGWTPRHAADATARQSPQQQQQQELQAHQYYDYYSGDARKTDPGPSYDQRHVQQRAGEETYDYDPYHSRDRQFEREESFEEEVTAATAAAPSSTPSSSYPRENILSGIFSLAQRLLPTVLKRLDRRVHEQPLSSSADYEDDFAGRCSPIGTPAWNDRAATSPSAAARVSPMFYGDNNFKTTGLEESDLVDEGDEEGGGESRNVDEMDGDMNTPEYLPRSAALLVSALQSSARNINRYPGGRSGSLGSLESVEDFFNSRLSPRTDRRTMEMESREGALSGSIRNDDLDASPGSHAKNVRRYPDGGSLASSESVEDFFKAALLSPQTGRRTMEMESRGDALLESIRNDDLDSERRSGGAALASATRRLFQGPQNAANRDSSPSASDAAAFFDDDSVAGSMGGDMARLTQSIANIQRDLAEVDFSHLEDVHDDGFGGVSGLEAYDGEGGLAGRIKLWLTRGTIVEQKLLNTYVNPMDGDDQEMSGANGYADNPVLVWSLALMWAFVVLILMHPKIAELVEGRDDAGQLADVIEWLFN